MEATRRDIAANWRCRLLSPQGSPSRKFTPQVCGLLHVHLSFLHDGSAGGRSRCTAPSRSSIYIEPCVAKAACLIRRSSQHTARVSTVLISTCAASCVTAQASGTCEGAACSGAPSASDCSHCCISSSSNSSRRMGHRQAHTAWQGTTCRARQQGRLSNKRCVLTLSTGCLHCAIPWAVSVAWIPSALHACHHTTHRAVFQREANL